MTTCKVFCPLLLVAAVVCMGMLSLAKTPPIPGNLNPANPADGFMYPAGQEEIQYGGWLVTNVTSAPKVEVLSDHADIAHEEASMVRDTCRTRGVYQVWRDRVDKRKFHLLCMTIDGKLVDWIVKVTGGSIVEVTAFMPKDGTINQVVSYVMRTCVRFKSAAW